MFSRELILNYPYATRFLTNAISKDKLANSYVFIGNDSKDLTELVINLAKILNCKNNAKNSIPCDQCLNCKWLNKNEHPQALIKISPDPQSKKEQVKIDTIRELLNTLQITSGYFRVIYFEDASSNCLSPESCNVLLKTVEETPPNTVFIFATTNHDNVLKTILSRSQVIYLSKKHSTIEESIQPGSMLEVDENITGINSEAVFEKTKKTIEILEKSEIKLKDYLIKLALTSYKNNKYSSPKHLYKVYNSLLTAHKKHRAFIQPKILIQDLLLECQ